MHTRGTIISIKSLCALSWQIRIIVYLYQYSINCHPDIFLFINENGMNYE